MKPVKRLVIVGGGTAGWMTAAAISQLFKSQDLEVTLVESEQIGTVGVGEATIPHIRYFNQRLGIAEDEFMRATSATYKLGIEFTGWGRQESCYIHPFGDFGSDHKGVPFHHWWVKKQQTAKDSLFDYSLPVIAAKLGAFDYPAKDGSVLSAYSYAFHLDAGLYAQFLRTYAEQRGVQRTEGKIAHVRQDSVDGSISSLVLEDGREVAGEFFIDCSGFRALLIEEVLAAGFESWRHLLPCDSAVAMPTQGVANPPPFTRAMAESAGWQWRIPLQHRAGNGHVFASDFISSDRATERLMATVDAPALADPRVLRFEAGRRRLSWSKNCVAIGLSSGFLEPLESTSIYLIQLGIMKLIELFPSVEGNEHRQAEFNRVMEREYRTVRDFLVLHYHANSRDDSEFWRYCRNMPIPDSLQERVDIFRSAGLTIDYQHGIFMQPSWLAVFVGQGIVPAQPHPLTDEEDIGTIVRTLDSIKRSLQAAAAGLPSHQQALNQYVNSGASPSWPAASFNLYGRSHDR